VPTLYECGNCKQITTTVWTWNNKQLCRVCFGRERLGDGGSGGVPADKSMRLVRADGTIAELNPTVKRPTEAINYGGAATRKIRIPVKEESK
jgi:hypothetical protein